jgi:hypothetical protein
MAAEANTSLAIAACSARARPSNFAYSPIPRSRRSVTPTAGSIALPCNVVRIGRIAVAALLLSAGLTGCAIFALADAAATVVATGVKVTAKAVGAVADAVIPGPAKDKPEAGKGTQGAADARQ